MSLDKVLRYAEGVQLSAAGTNAGFEDTETAELVLAARLGVGQLQVLLADDDNDTEPDDDEDDEDEDDSKGGGGSHAGHPTYKKLTGKGMNPKMAAAMCAKADNKVAATALVSSLSAVLAELADAQVVSLAAPTAAERKKADEAGNSLPGGAYPIPNVKRLHAAAVLAASHHGDWQAAQRLIRKRARELGVDINSLPGFGGSDEENEKVAASALRELVVLTGLPEDHVAEFLALAGKAAVPLQAFHHGTHTGTHAHGHMTMAIHDHEHSHNRDSMHDRHAHGGSADEWGTHGGEY